MSNGETAYTAFHQFARTNGTAKGFPIPWGQLRTSERRQWDAVALAVIQANRAAVQSVAAQAQQINRGD